MKTLRKSIFTSFLLIFLTFFCALAFVSCKEPDNPVPDGKIVNSLESFEAVRVIAGKDVKLPTGGKEKEISIYSYQPIELDKELVGNIPIHITWNIEINKVTVKFDILPIKFDGGSYFEHYKRYVNNLNYEELAGYERLFKAKDTNEYVFIDKISVYSATSQSDAITADDVMNYIATFEAQA